MKKIYLSALALALLVSGGVATKAFAETANTNVNLGVQSGFGPGMMGYGGMMRNQNRLGVFGVVTAISGNTITITSKGFGPNATTATYTVNASGATVIKDGVSSSVSSIVVGDYISVEGSISGNSVTATTIRDGKGAGPFSNRGLGNPILDGNGQPIVGGEVSAVSGSTITITNKSNTTYTIDISKAKITKSDKAGSATDIVVGDTILTQGTINGTSVTAVNVIDEGQIKTNVTTGSNVIVHRGFFGRIGSFFAHLFGF